MISALIGFVIEHFFTVLAASAGVVLFILRSWWKRAGRLEERSANKAKEADSYAKHLKELEDASIARSAVQPGSVSNDRYRRD